MAWSLTHTRATQSRGLENAAGQKVIEHMNDITSLENAHQVQINVPMWPWSEEPAMKKAGQVAYAIEQC